jgi:prepilin-type N-terminal cleavage/methylation domain-containing protein/prepilin-type processing-associated H-X9-DG protein
MDYMQTAYSFRHAGASGFSLIELLVVLSVIAVLFSLMMPALAVVRGAAHSTKCLSNLRQYQMANLSYAGDWKGSFVPLYYTSSTPAGWSDPWYDNYDFIDRLYSDPATRYAAAAGSSLVKSELCPLAVKRKGQTTSAVAYSYGMNAMYYRTVPAAAGESARVARNSMDGIAAKVAFLDGLDWSLTLGGASPTSYWVGGVPSTEGYTRFKTTAYRHRQRANAAFFDGHVAALTWSDLYVTGMWK